MSLDQFLRYVLLPVVILDAIAVLILVVTYAFL